MLKDIRKHNYKKTNRINTVTYMWTYQGRDQYGLPMRFDSSKVLNLVTAGSTLVGQLGKHFTVNTDGRIQLTSRGHQLLGGRSGRGSRFSVTTMV